MTITEYLLTIDADYDNPGTKIGVFIDHATPAQVRATNGLPYAIVEHLEEIPEIDLMGNQSVVGQTVDVSLFQEPGADGSTPDRKRMVAVWHKVMDAVHSVNANTYGRSFIALHRGPALEPVRDRQTKGLFASVRFRLVSARG